VVKLTVVHDGFAPGSGVRAGVSNGWPAVPAGLETLLETGSALPASPEDDRRRPMAGHAAGGGTNGVKALGRTGRHIPGTPVVILLADLDGELDRCLTMTG
jgi:hypothetical protein